MSNEISFVEMPEEEKIANLKQYLAPTKKQLLAREYLVALQSHDAATIADFERFGTDLYSILDNKKEFLEAEEWGFTNFTINEHGRIVIPKFENIEVIAFKKQKKAMTSNEITIGAGPNNLWAYALSLGKHNQGASYGLGIYSTKYPSRLEALQAALNEVVKYHSSPDGVPAIISEAKGMLEGLKPKPVIQSPIRYEALPDMPPPPAGAKLVQLSLMG